MNGYEREEHTLHHPKTLFAFVHIHKAAGTTLRHILRRNFFMQHIGARPFSGKSGGIFRARDLKIALRLNPALRCISGHAVRTFSGLETLVPDIKYFTVLREPVKRFVSHFQYAVDVMKTNITFEQRLETEENCNYQTKAIVGNDDLDSAKEILSQRFWLVGTCEQFDEFLVLLKKKMQPKVFDPLYTSQNRAVDRSPSKNVEVRTLLLSRYRDSIIERNQLDIELFKYARDEILAKEIAEYGPDFQKDVSHFRSELERSRPTMFKPYVDYAVRHFYYDPMIGLIRVLNGHPYRGGY